MASPEWLARYSFRAKPCAVCAQSFTPNSGAQRVCHECKAHRAPCLCGCGKEIPWVSQAGHGLGLVHREYAHGHNAKGERNAKWNGGRSAKGGKSGMDYVVVKAPDRPDADTRGYAYEHRIVAEQALGRPLLESEDVHHRNGDKRDNRPENLAVFDKAEHTRFHHLARRDKVFAVALQWGLIS